jgi:hypothetical protein
MLDFLNSKDIKHLQTALAEINPSLITNLEFETLIHYPAIENALRKKKFFCPRINIFKAINFLYTFLYGG